jgi:sugar phosphate permease
VGKIVGRLQWGGVEGGRGLVAALMSSFIVFLVGSQSSATGEIIDKAKTLSSIYLSISIFMVIVSLIVWFGLKGVETKEAQQHNWSFDKALEVAKDLNIWLLAIIILCAYCSYKNVENFPVYMKDVKGMSILESSQFTSYIFWVRPISALLAGFFADKLTLKVKGGRFITLIICFALGALSQLLLAMNAFSDFSLILSSILIGSCFAFALRSIYFSVFGEFKVNDNIVGTAVGIVSLVGYLPDFFFGALTGHLIDSYPGQTGFTYVFSFTGALLVLGSFSSYLCYRKVLK